MRLPSRSAIVIIAIVVLAASARAQTPSRPPGTRQMLEMLQTMRVANAPAIAPLVNALISDTAAHMEMALARAATAQDSARAAMIVRTMRSSLARYADVTEAERDGYVLFLPWLADQPVYHYNNIQNAIAAATAFDVERPTSLLYRKDAGRLVLVGAMYTALASDPPDALHARLPLGIAHWHKHVNFCGPRPDSVGIAAPNDSATLARWLAIETAERCTAAGGVFLPNLFGWMAHVNAFQGDGFEDVWGHDSRDHMMMHHHPPR